MVEQADGHVELTKKESRQAEGSKDSSLVLTVSLFLSVLAGVVIYILFF